MGNYYIHPTTPIWPSYNGWPGYGYYGSPIPQTHYSHASFRSPQELPQGLTALPRHQKDLPPYTFPEEQDTFQSREPGPSRVASEPEAPIEEVEVKPKKPAPQTAAQMTPPASPSSTPQTYAEEIGTQAGRMVTRLIEEHPEWEQKLKSLNVQKYLDDPGLLLSGVHQAYQNTPLLKWASKQFSNQLVKALPDQFEPAATQVVDWLNSPLPAAT